MYCEHIMDIKEKCTLVLNGVMFSVSSMGLNELTVFHCRFQLLKISE